MGGAETLVSNAQNAFGLQKPNVGFGSGVMPTPEMAGQNFGLATPSDLFRQQESIMAPSMPNVITQTGTELTGENIGKQENSRHHTSRKQTHPPKQLPYINTIN